MRSLIAGLLCLGLFGVAGCGSDSDGSDRAITVDGEGAGGKKAPTLVAHGRELTQDQIDKALLAVGDMPTGWALSDEEEDEEESDDEVVEPAKCGEILDSLESSSGGEPTAEGETNFNNGGPFGMQLSQTIESHEEPVASDALAKVAEALEQCPEFTSTDSEGDVTKMKVSAMSFPNLGDQTLALSMDLEQSDFEFTMSVVMVAVGHNTVSVIGGGFVGVPGKDLEKISRAAVDKLEKTA